jgi:hypothetical protein
LAKIFPVENLHTRDFPGDNVDYDHPSFCRHSHIPETGTEAAFWLGASVKCGADIVCAAAPVLNLQTGNLRSQCWFAVRFEKLPEFSCKRRKCIDKEQGQFGLSVHRDLQLLFESSSAKILADLFSSFCP